MVHNLSKQNIFEEMVIPPSPGYLVCYCAANFVFRKNEILNLNTIFLDQKKILLTKGNKRKFFFKRTNNDFINDVTNKLIEGKIVASYYENNEVGPRSLENSIFCDARNKEAD